MDLLELTAQSLRRHHLGRDDCILVALSGGVDSSVLLDLLDRHHRKGGPTVEVLHVDHGVRPDSAGDARFCEDQARRRGLPFHLSTLSFPAHPNQTSPNQATLRDARLSAIAEVAQSRGITTIAMGHHGDDAIETALLNLDRGAGLRGLTALREWSPFPGAPGLSILRPLLGSSRAEVQAYAELRGLSWREDPTNAQPKYARNRLRHGLLASLSPLDRSTLRSALATLAEADDALDALARTLLNEARHPTGTARRFELDAPPLRAAPAPLVGRLLLIAAPGLDGAAIDAVLDLLRADDLPTRRTLPGWLVTATEDHRLLFEAYRERGARDLLRAPPAPLLLDPFPTGDAPFLDFHASWGLGPHPDDPFTFTAPLETLPRPLRIGPPPPGARLPRQGPDGLFHQRVTQALSDMSVPQDRRRRWPCLLAPTDEVLWLSGAPFSTPPLATGTTTTAPLWYLHLTPRFRTH